MREPIPVLSSPPLHLLASSFQQAQHQIVTLCPPLGLLLHFLPQLSSDLADHHPYSSLGFSALTLLHPDHLLELPQFAFDRVGDSNHVVLSIRLLPVQLLLEPINPGSHIGVHFLKSVVHPPFLLLDHAAQRHQLIAVDISSAVLICILLLSFQLNEVQDSPLVVGNPLLYG